MSNTTLQAPDLATEDLSVAIGEWCSTVRHMHECGTLSDGDSRVADRFPAKPAWAMRTTVHVEEYPVMLVEFWAGYSSGDVWVDALATHQVWTDATGPTPADDRVRLAGDIEPEDVHVMTWPDSGVFTFAQANHLVALTTKLLTHLEANGVNL